MVQNRETETEKSQSAQQMLLEHGKADKQMTPADFGRLQSIVEE